jgi:YesN/AraC family two-component response regulator
MSAKQVQLKHMFTKSCIKLLEHSLKQNFPEIEFEVSLGLVKWQSELSPQKIESLKNVVSEIGFPAITSPDQTIVESIKLAALELIFLSMNINSLVRNSDYISNKLQLPYDKLSRIFTKETGTQLEKYLIVLKIEKTKELIDRNEFSLSEIAFVLGYSSVQYLSNQFKKICNATISTYKYDGVPERVPVELIFDHPIYHDFLYKHA